MAPVPQSVTLNGDAVLRTLIVAAGEDAEQTFLLNDPSNRQADAASVQLTFRMGVNGSPTRVNLTKRTDGLWVAVFTSALTRALKTGRYAYEVWVTLGDGKRIPVGRTGNLYLQPSVGR